MKRPLLFWTTVFLLLIATTAAHAESWMIGAQGDKVLGMVQTIRNVKYFVSCPSRVRVSLTKFQVKVIDAPGQHCHYPAEVDSALSSDGSDDDSAEKAKQAERDQIRKILTEDGYTAADSDLQ